MRLVANYRAVLKHAWSIRLIALCVGLIVLDAVLPYLPLPVPEGVLQVLAAVIGLAAIAARLVAQRAVETIIADPDWETGDGHEDPH